MRNPRPTDERGMALAVAIFALVVIGALVAGAFYGRTLEQRTGRNSMYADEAAEAAEAGAAESSRRGTRRTSTSSCPAPDRVLGNAAGAGREVSVTVTRLNEQLFLVQSHGSRVNPSGGTLARRTVAPVARLASLGEGPKPRSLTGSPSSSTATPSPSVATTPRRPPGRLCAGPQPVGNARGATVSGRLHHLRRRRRSSGSRRTPTSSSRRRRSVAARVRLSDDRYRCDIRDGSNWGEPALRGLHQGMLDVFPDHLRQRLAAEDGQPGRGQGLLLVEGDLEIAGDFEFYGLIVAKGGIKISGTATGRRRAPGPGRRTSATTTAQRQHDAAVLVVRADQGDQGSAFAEPLAYRSWAQLH